MSAGKQTDYDIQEIRSLVDDLMKKPDAKAWFNDPVPTDTPFYYEVIKEPMDLGTIRGRLWGGRSSYKTAQAVIADIELVWSNCREFNEDSSEPGQAALRLSKYMQGKLRALRAGGGDGLSKRSSGLGGKWGVEQRRHLGERITLLPTERLSKVIRILKEKTNAHAVHAEEKEHVVEFSLLSDETLDELLKVMDAEGGKR